MPSVSGNSGKPLGKISGMGIPKGEETFVSPSFPSTRRADSWRLSDGVLGSEFGRAWEQIEVIRP